MLTNISSLGVGGAGIPDTLPQAIQELQSLRLSVVPGGAAGTVMTIPRMAPEDTITAVLDLTSVALLDPTTFTPTYFGCTSTLALTTKQLVIWWYDHQPTLSYQEQVVADQAVAYWPMTEVSGTTIKDATGTYTGTLTANVTLGAAGLAGQPAIQFTGTSGTATGVINISPTVPEPWPTFTVEAWVRHEGTTDASRLLLQLLVTRAIGLNWPQMSMVLALMGDGHAGPSGPPWYYYEQLAIPTTQQWFNVPVPEVLPLTWYHFVSTYDGTTVRMYRNGQVVLTQAATLSRVAGSHQTALGGMASGLGVSGSKFKGRLQDVAYYTRVLTPSEITKHYKLKVPA